MDRLEIADKAAAPSSGPCCTRDLPSPWTAHLPPNNRMFLVVSIPRPGSSRRRPLAAQAYVALCRKPSRGAFDKPFSPPKF